MAAERTPSGFGSKLRDARERRGISLRQIANATKISMSVLEALERNDLARLPGGIFSRAFVRAYAIEVGLDPEKAIQEFIAQFPNDSVTAGHLTWGPVQDSEKLESDRRLAAVFLWLLALGIPIVGVVLYFGVMGRRAIPAPAEAPARALSAPAAPVRPAAGDRFVVGLTATARCFVAATVDGQRVIERELQPGERQQLDVRREMVLTAANAGALTMTLDGASAKPLGRAGETATARLNLTNFKDYLAAP